MKKKSYFFISVATASILLLSGCSGQGSSTDPIEQVRVVLDGRLTYEEIDSLTSQAMLSYGLDVSDETRSRMWSAVLSIAKTTGIRGEDIMTCALVKPAESVKFPDMVGICGATLAPTTP